MAWLTINHIENSVERHKITVIQCNPALLASLIQHIRSDGYWLLDVGYDIAKFIYSLSSRRYLALDVHDYFQKLIRKHTLSTEGLSLPVVILYNIGILLEPELQLNVSHLLKETAKSCHVILIWEGEIHNSRILSWPSNEAGYTIDLSHIPFKIEQYEI